MSTSYLQAFLPKSLHPFVTLSYPLPSAPSSLPLPLRHLLSSSHPAAPTGKAYTRLAAVAGTAEKLYGKGPKDLYFAVFCAIAFTVLREIMLRYILSAFARAWLMSSYRKSKGASKSETGRDRRMKRRDRKKMEHTVTRFAEQGWSFIYCTVFWSMGMLILYRLPSPLSPQSLWGSYPQTSLPGLTKFYYLAQLGWWFHQIYVINSEKRRKDHWQMFGHHLLTIALITTSYATHFTRVGTVIHALMDFCDILLPLAKMLRYLSLLKLCDFTFVVFLVSWLLSRQIGLSLVIKTAYFDAPKYIPFKWDPKNGYYLTEGAYYGFIGAITILLCLASVWFCMACMVAVRVVRGEGAEDSRSDDEEEDELEVDVSEDGSTLSDVPESSSTVYDKAPAVSSVDAGIRKRK